MSGFDSNENMEQLSSSKPRSSSSPLITLTKAIELGEYDPEYLSQFDDWKKLSRHSQFELIRKAIENRLRQLIGQYAEINNVLDFSKKPHLQEALKNIDDQRRKVLQDKEDLYLEYSRL